MILTTSFHPVVVVTAIVAENPSSQYSVVEYARTVTIRGFYPATGVAGHVTGVEVGREPIAIAAKVDWVCR